MRLLFLFFILLFSNSLFAQVSCEELIHYRDVELVKDYNLASYKYKLAKDAINDLKKNKDELLNKNDRWWEMSTNTAISNGGEGFVQILQIIKTSCNLIANTLKINPTTGTVEKVIEKTAISAKNIYDAISTGKKIKSIVNEGAEKTAYKEVLTMSGPLGQAIKTAWEFSIDLEKMTQIPKERSQLKKDVIRILNMIETKANEYVKIVESNSEKIKDINEIVLGIDKYLSEKCKDVKPKATANKSVEKKEKSGQITNDKIAVNKNDNKTFFVFLYTTMGINDSLYTIMSNPIFHLGQLSDLMDSEKNEFTEKIKKYFPWKTIDTFLKENNNTFPEIEIIYSQPYDTKLLNTRQECVIAIQEYKNMLKATTSGLPGEEKKVYLQMN